MCGIKYTATTKEIEIEGSESFIETNFGKIRELLVGAPGAREAKTLEKSFKVEKRVILVNPPEEAIIHEAMAPQAPLPDVSLEPRVKRPPLRKYIRKDGVSTISPAPPPVLIKQEVSGGVSIASLKEKFGLSEQQIAVMIREAEREGRVRKDSDGSYVWSN